MYQQHAKNIDIVFDQFLCECEHFFANRALEMKIMLRSFVVCWKLYAQAVVSTLDENLVTKNQHTTLGLFIFLGPARSTRGWGPVALGKRSPY